VKYAWNSLFPSSNWLMSSSFKDDFAGYGLDGICLVAPPTFTVISERIELVSNSA